MSASVAPRVAVPSPDSTVLAAALAGAGYVVWLLARDGAWSSVGLFVVAGLLGATFLVSEFGYTAMLRQWLVRGNGAGLAAGLMPVAVVAAVVIPVSHLVDGYGGYIAPIGLPLVLGAAVFGVGMQLANGCGSGTLYTAGGGSRRLWVALPFFCAGGVLGTLVLPWMLALPNFGSVDFGEIVGVWGGLALTLAALAGLAAMVLRGGARPSRGRLIAGAGIGGLAALAFLLSGQPWGVTMGLTVWGAKIATLLGADLSGTAFWNWDGPKRALGDSVLASDSSLMDIGMLLGAAVVASWRGSFRSQAWPDARGIVAAALGGLLMGIGGRLGFGCNIGAFMSGLGSGSLHGLVWFAAVLPGCWVGIKLRPGFGLAV